MLNRSRPGKTLVLGAVALAAGMALAACAKDADKSASGSSSPSSAAAHSQFSAPPAAPLRADEHFQNLQMPTAYTPKAPSGGTDEYRCFLVDPKITKTEYLTGSQFLPQNTAIVHHAIFFRIGAADAQQARQLDADSPGEGWTCFGDTGVKGDASWVAAWAPGANETLLPSNLGFEMQPGALMVMQVHYNLLATGGKAGGSDQSSIRLRFNDGAAKMTALATQQLPAPIELPCSDGDAGPLCDRAAAVADVTHRFGADAGRTVNGLNELCNAGQAPVAGPTQHCDRKVPQAGTIYTALGHMHLRGKSIKIELNPGTATAQTLLDVPNFNFDDQAVHVLPTPVKVKPGDTLRVTCTHDSKLRQLLPQLRQTAPRYVVWGDGTSDEMCLGVLAWTPGV
jgi:hypothetical protein